MRREEVFDLERSDGKEWKKERGGKTGEKMEGIKKGGITICCHLFVSAPCNYDYEDDNMVFYFNFVIMLKWQSSI
jgi:hypothetical protein